MITGPGLGATAVASPRWMCDRVTAVILVRLSVQSISVPRSTNVATPVPADVKGGLPPSAAAFMFAATYTLPDGAVVSDPQLVANAATPAAAMRPRVSVLTVLRMEPPNGRVKNMAFGGYYG